MKEIQSHLKSNGNVIFTLLCLLAVTFVTFYQITGHDFISYDDAAYVTENPNVTNGLSLSSLLWALTSFHSSNWHPMTWLSHMLDCNLYGLNSYGHHLTNIILHVANTSLLYYLLFRLTGGRWKSLFVAALFALHPLHVESVAWVAERKDLLSTFFMLLTVLAYKRYVDRRELKWYLASLSLYVFGLMSKPMLVTLPLLLLLLDYWPLERWERLSWQEIRPIIREKVPFFVMMTLSCIITFYAQYKGGSVATVEVTPLLLRIQNAINSYLAYILKMIWPHNLAIIYPQLKEIPASRSIITGLALLAITYCVAVPGKRHKFLTVGWLWYLVTLVPVIGVVQVGSQAMADRYSYITLIGLFIAIAWGMAEVVKKYKIHQGVTASVGVLALLILASLTWVQLGYWQNSITLFDHAAKVVPDNNIALRILGNNYAKEGNVDAAIASLRQAIDISPDDANAHTDLGVALASRQSYDEAIDHYVAAIKYNPRSANAHYNYGVALAGQKRFEEAVAHYSESLRIDPKQSGAKANMGAALYHLGRVDEAIECLQDALNADPANDSIKQFLNIAIARQMAGRK